jgi:NAD(P)-dependent dehydrogenase (short-subunit alcohol dehydrogenase family)
VLLARREELLAKLAGEIGGEYELCDVGDRASVERAAAAVRERHPAVSLLANNAGIPGRDSFLELDPERIEEVMRVNYLGSVWCLRAFLPALEAGAPAHVVNVVSVAGLVAFPTGGPYCASKHAQIAFSRATAAELRPRGIRVHTILPGFVETEGFPQRGFLPSWATPFVVGPERIAERIVTAVDDDDREVHVPAWYVVASRAQGLLPGLVARGLARAARSRRAARAPARPPG